MKYLQQGDVILKKIDTLPEGCTKLDTKVLQLGEVTGHKHQFQASADVQVLVDPSFAGLDMSITPDEGKFIVVGGTLPVSLLHEEHNPVIVEPGIYQVDIVREFDYDSMEMTRVID
jgi:hypothetical protein